MGALMFRALIGDESIRFHGLLFHVAALTFWLYRIGFPLQAASMISITHFTNTKEAKDYHAHLSRDDYFGKDAREIPVYEGKTATQLGIGGMEATKESFYSLGENRNPLTSERLTSRTRDDRRIMTDVTFDVGKSVTLAALYDKRINGLVDNSMRETMADIESEMAVRVRKGGKDEDRKSGNIIYVMWPHETTRPLEDGTVDPQKHRHVTCLNVSLDPKENILAGAFIRTRQCRLGTQGQSRSPDAWRRLHPTRRCCRFGTAPGSHSGKARRPADDDHEDGAQ